MNTQTGILDSYKDKAIRAHNWTSFSPERRGEQLINDYNGQLSEDIEELKAAGIESEVIESYVSRYKSLFNSWLSAKSNCFSTMITGGSGVNLRKHAKTQRSEQRNYEVFQEWRKRAKAAIVRKAQPKKTFLSEIDRYRADLEGMKRSHELMKQGNKRIAAARKSGEDITAYLTDTFGIKPHMIEWTLKFGFGLANNNANMKRVEERIKLMEAKETRSQNIGGKTFQFDGFTVTYNHEADRLQIKHPTKPDYSTISEMKKNGFRWSPSFQAWQRNLNTNSIWVTERVFGIKLPSVNFQ